MLKQHWSGNLLDSEVLPRWPKSDLTPSEKTTSSHRSLRLRTRVDKRYASVTLSETGLHSADNPEYHTRAAAASWSSKSNLDKEKIEMGDDNLRNTSKRRLEVRAESRFNRRPEVTALSVPNRWCGAAFWHTRGTYMKKLKKIRGFLMRRKAWKSTWRQFLG